MAYFPENSDFRETSTLGSFDKTASDNSFDGIIAEAYNEFKRQDIDIMSDALILAKNDVINEAYKEKLLGGLQDYCESMTDATGRPAMLYEMASQLWDNVKGIHVTEASTTGSLLPLKTVDYPILVKQLVKSATKDIMQSEVTPTPKIKKQIEQTFITHDATQKKWKYPQCFFDDTFREVISAGKGLKIPSTEAVSIPVMNYDLVTSMMVAHGAQAGRDKVAMGLEIVACEMQNAGSTATVRVELPLPMKIDLHTGAWLNGMIKTGDGSGVSKAAHDDLIMGHMDFATGLMSLNCANGKVTKVYFAGNLSNELNENTTSISYEREQLEWTIDDGTRIDAPFSLEELNDAKALLQLDLYKKTYDDIGRILGDMEDSDILAFLDDQYTKYKGFSLDPLGFNSFIREQNFNAKNETALGVVPSEFIEKELKFALDRFLIDLADTAKMEDMTFVVYGNPRYISLLGGNVKWLVQSGDSVGGIKVNYSYGIMTTGNYKIQVVSTNKLQASKGLHKGLRVIPYPIGKEQMTFKHYKHSMNIMTSANSAYRSANRPGGSYTYIVGTSRYVSTAVQGIQGKMNFTNTGFILEQ